MRGKRCLIGLGRGCNGGNEWLFGGGVVRVVGELASAPEYCKLAIAVMLSTAIGASMNGEAATKYLPVFLLVVTRTLVVWPGAIRTVSVLNGLT